ncbi:MAG: flagellar export chaperone FlgN [Actinomycetales bacterium]
MGLPEVSSVLWRERELLELLLFKLEEEQLLLSSGRTRWLARATREVEMVLGEIRKAEVLRAAEVEVAGAQLGLGSSPSLSQLAERAPEPWRGLLREHRNAFHTMTAEISAMAEANRELLTAGQRATREALLALNDEVTTYSASGGSAPVLARAGLIDEAM